MDPRIRDWAARIQAAGQQGQALGIQGNNSLGLCGAATNPCLDLSGWQGVVEYDPGELAITVRSGTTWQTLLQVLEEQGQIPACSALQTHPTRTVGGIVATGFNGPARPWLGDVRGAVLGVAMLNGQGQLLTFGGRVMKNVAGFDLSRLQTGAWGRFGPILEVSLRTRPAPQHGLHLRLDAPLEELPSLRHHLQQAPLTGLAWYQGRFYLRLQGLPAGVQQAADLPGAEEDAGFWARHESLQCPIYRQRPLYRILLPALDVPTYRTWLDTANDALLDWGGRLLWLATDMPQAALQQQVQKAGGWLQPWPVTGPVPLPAARAAVVHRLQQAFDPAGVFRNNPNREAAHANPST